MTGCGSPSERIPVLTEPLNNLLAELRTGFDATYGERLCGFYLYGSYARGDQECESDVDVLLVLKEVNYWEDIKRTGELASRLSLKYGVSVSRVFIPERDWEQSQTPFLRSVRGEAIAA